MLKSDVSQLSKNCHRAIPLNEHKVTAVASEENPLCLRSSVPAHKLVLWVFAIGGVVGGHESLRLARGSATTNGGTSSWIACRGSGGRGRGSGGACCGFSRSCNIIKPRLHLVGRHDAGHFANCLQISIKRILAVVKSLRIQASSQCLCRQVHGQSCAEALLQNLVQLGELRKALLEEVGLAIACHLQIVGSVLSCAAHSRDFHLGGEQSEAFRHHALIRFLLIKNLHTLNDSEEISGRHGAQQRSKTKQKRENWLEP